MILPRVRYQNSGVLGRQQTLPCTCAHTAANNTRTPTCSSEKADAKGGRKAGRSPVARAASPIGSTSGPANRDSPHNTVAIQPFAIALPTLAFTSEEGPESYLDMDSGVGDADVLLLLAVCLLLGDRVLCPAVFSGFSVWVEDVRAKGRLVARKLWARRHLCSATAAHRIRYRVRATAVRLIMLQGVLRAVHVYMRHFQAFSSPVTTSQPTHDPNPKKK